LTINQIDGCPEILINGKSAGSRTSSLLTDCSLKLLGSDCGQQGKF